MTGLLNYKDDPVFGLIGDTYKGIGGLIGDTASNVWGGMDTMDKAALSTSLIPGVGDVVGAINDARYLYKEPTLANAGMAGLGLLPFVPSLGMVKAYHGNEDLIKIADDAPKGADDLPMDYASRMQRADELGYTHDVYHGTTKDIKEFDTSMANPESDLGGGIYTTTSPDDASINYSSLESSQDLTQKIELRAERIESELGVDMDEARKLAKDELYGGAENVMPLKVKLENPVYVGGNEKTYLDMDYPDADPADYLDEAGGDLDIAQELADDARYEFEPEGKLTEFMESLRYNAREYGVDAEKSIGEIYEKGMDGGLSADDIIEIMKADDNLMDAVDEAGNLANHELMRKSFEDVGFDGFIDQAPNSKWGSGSGRQNYMQGMDEDTRHIIPFKGNQIRSPNATFDPKKIESLDILSGLIGLNNGYV